MATSFLQTLPASVRHRLAWEQESGALQCLCALGYLDVQAEPGTEAVAMATAAFRQDWEAFQVVAPAVAAPLVASLPLYLPNLDPTAPLSADEQHILQGMMALEGEVGLPLQAALSGEGLAGRVLRYRMQVLGWQDVPMDQALSRLQAWTGTDRAAALALTGHVYALMQQLSQARAGAEGFQGVLYLPGAKTGQGRAQAKAERFEAELKGDLSAAQWALFEKQVGTQAGKRVAAAATSSYLAQALSDPLHALLQRLFHLQLWIDGFADGPQPGADVTWAAVDRLFQFCADAGLDAPDRACLSAHVQDGIHAVNLAYFLRAVCGAGLPNPRDTTWSALHTLFDQEASAADTVREAVETRLEGLASEEAPAKAQAYPGPVGVARLVDWVRQQVDGIGEAVEQVFNRLQAGVQGLMARLMRGFDLLERGLACLTQPLSVTTAVLGGRVVTTAGPNFQMVTRLEGMVSAELLATHRDRVAAYTETLTAIWQIAGEVIAWGVALAGSPLSWIRLGLHIAQRIAYKAAPVGAKPLP